MFLYLCSMPHDGQIGEFCGTSLRLIAYFILTVVEGALEIGIVVSTFLFGITSAQTYNYYQLFPRDPKWTKRLVTLQHNLRLSVQLTMYESSGGERMVVNPPLLGSGLELRTSFSGSSS